MGKKYIIYCCAVEDPVMKSFRLSLSRSLSRMGLSPWMLLGAALILGLTLAGISVRSNQRERAFMVHNLIDRAEALIWALEAGTRTGLRLSPGAVLGMAVADTLAQVGGNKSEAARRLGINRKTLLAKLGEGK